MEEVPDSPDGWHALRVCGSCTQLFGPVRPSRGAGILSQECRCTPGEPRRWTCGDFDLAFELCYACACAVVHSGSRFSSFHCDDCRPAVKALNTEVGALVLPMGRHSLMNGVALRPTARSEERRVGKECRL